MSQADWRGDKWGRGCHDGGMKISFMTLGCPNWTLDDICSKGASYGFDAVDFRGLGPEIDVTKLPAFTTGVEATKRQLEGAGLAVSGISSSLAICNPERREANLEEARRTVPVALALGAPNIRVFGGNYPEGITRAQAADCGAAVMEEILKIDGAEKLNWLFETHDEWIKGEQARMLIDRVSHPAFGVLWDTGHTYRVTKETPAQTYAAVGKWVRYAHIKDAAYEPSHPNAMKDGWRYVIPGTGQLPLAESITLLKSNGFSGYLLCEHEKRWHPDLVEPEVIFPAFVKWVKPLIGRS